MIRMRPIAALAALILVCLPAVCYAARRSPIATNLAGVADWTTGRDALLPAGHPVGGRRRRRRPCGAAPAATRMCPLTGGDRAVAPRTSPRPVLFAAEYPFVNHFKMARPWFSANATHWEDTARPLQLDSTGHVKALAPGQYARSVLFAGTLEGCCTSHAMHGTGRTCCMHATSLGQAAASCEHPLDTFQLSTRSICPANRPPMAAGAPPDPGLSGKRFVVLYSGKGVLEYGNVQVSREGRREVGAPPSRCRRR